MTAAGSGATRPPSPPLRFTLRLVAGLNLAAFAAEIAAALASGSVSLFGDSVDFLEDASVNLIVLAGLARSARARARLGTVLAAAVLVPSLATLAMAWHRARSGTAPEPVVIGTVGLLALAVNVACALLLAQHRTAGGSLTRAAFLSARNDVLANLAVIAAGVATSWWRSFWPDLIVGVAIALLNAGAAWEIRDAAKAERDPGAPGA